MPKAKKKWPGKVKTVSTYSLGARVPGVDLFPDELAADIESFSASPSFRKWKSR